MYEVKTTDGQTHYVAATRRAAAVSKISTRYPLSAQIVSVKKVG